ncbi:MAG: 3-hydroxybutyryl-CoA dehydrogenase [Chloroflexota bacterium]|nr:3-hydroxybutyryl-CoA dehydrogenase [Chloroflexota bacterium]
MHEVAVIGAGTMGSGIAQVFAQAGDTVRLVENNPQQLERGLAGIERGLKRSVEKGRLSPEQCEQVLRLVKPSLDLRDAGLAELVVEAIHEDAVAKLDVFRQLDVECSPDTVLASNTSSISITLLGAATGRPDRVIGMHFFNPVPVMKLVEVIRGPATSDATYHRIESEARRLGKEPVEVRDFPGFVSNRVLMPMINEAIFALHEGVAGPDEIDTVMKLGMNHPMGPLELADFIGLDVCLNILNVLHDGFGDPKYRACPLLKQLVASGRLGRKTGRGFYEYDS